jgi:murein DD-endopeptidase MepM/ murein hydrolase activator NlpD
LKRTFTQKVKQVPSCAADSFEALLKLYVGKSSADGTIPTEANRRARTSAAMIGLAISMGAAGLLLPQQGDEVLAVEPVTTEPNLPNFAAPSSLNVATPIVSPAVVAASTPTESKPEAPKSFEEASSPVVQHQVREGETLWELSNSYQVQPEAIAASNNIQASAVLPVGQTLKIPAVNGIVHQVKAGDTLENLSESYGVTPAQLQATTATSVENQLKTGESVTVPGNVNDLLKARQDTALNSLKEQRNRLNDSLAELRSEESSNLSQQEAGANKVASTTQKATSVTLPSTAFTTEESVTATSKPVTVEVPSPQLASSPTVEPKAARSPQSSVVITVPTPEIASTPFTTPQIASTPQSSVIITVPTPEVASKPVIAPKVAVTPNSKLEPVTSLEATAKPQAPQPVVIPTVTSTEANLYQVKPGDTIEAIARRHGLSVSELIKANGLNNPNLLSVNQQIKIPQTSVASNTRQPLALIPGISSKAVSVATVPQRSVVTPPQANPTASEKVSPIVPTLPQSQKTRQNPVLAQSIRVENTQASSREVVDTQKSQSTQSNPYIDRLRSDILKLREDIGQQQETTQAAAPRNVVVPAVKTPTASSSNNASTQIRIDPQFNPKRANENLSVELQRRQQQLNQGPINIEVPPPELVASAPAPAGSYNPSLRPQIGQPVEPEMPGLSPDSPAQTKGYIWPAKGVLTSGYGWRWGRLHKGIDIAAPIGTPVVASAPGVIVTAGWNSGGYGNLVEIQHPDGSLTLYAHNNRVLVRRGQEVTQGQQIAEMGTTGYSTGPHSHFEVHPKGRGAVNPIAFLPRK